MQGVTLTIAVVASALIFFLSPVWWLIIYVALLAYYPSYLTVKVGTLDFSVTRIVILAIYANLFLRSHLVKNFKFTYLDIMVIIYFAAQLLAGLITTDLSKLLENRSGAAFDTVLPYFAVRTTITSRERYIFLLKGCLWVVAPLAIFGFYESLTGHNPVGFLKQYQAWELRFRELQPRLGFHRARFVFTHPIMFGVFFAILGPVCAGLLREVKRGKFPYYIAIAMMALGAFSSVSSGPILAALVAAAFIVFYRFRRHLKLAIVVFVIMCGLVDVISNRRFYYVPGRFTFSTATAWYRGRLIDVALFEGGMSGNWLTGYGIETDAAEKASSAWAAKIDYRPYVDIVNQYILILFQFGLVGLVSFFAVMAATTRELIKAFRASLLESDKWLIWCLAGSFIGELVAFVSFSLHTGQPTTLFFIMVGLCSAMPLIIADRNNPLLLRIRRANEELPYDVN